MAPSAQRPPAADRPPMGLRERKKLKTRAAIRRALYRLIADQGYEATTIEQIAAGAEVSPSTVSRYFATKEDIVLTDECDAVMEDMLRRRPASEPPLESLRFVVAHAVRALLEEDPDGMCLRARLLVEVPAVRARSAETTAETSLLLSRVLAERTGRDAGDLEVRVFTAAVMAALREVTLHWAERGRRDDLAALLDRALDTLGDGLSL
ncbi:TetR/AcrR family transcriptional regulator [Streptomyces wuyuanensis]|uniref:TetR/AcrR family transcriptional regulator n=1 Tax=Streptomyces wuyuanensis TaxID=1196353 RepID=UPI00342C5F48